MATAHQSNKRTHYALVAKGNYDDYILSFPLHKKCVPLAQIDEPHSYAKPIQLKHHRQRETCAYCGRLVCLAGNEPPSADHWNNEWEFV